MNMANHPSDFYLSDWENFRKIDSRLGEGLTLIYCWQVCLATIFVKSRLLYQLENMCAVCQYVCKCKEQSLGIFKTAESHCFWGGLELGGFVWSTAEILKYDVLYAVWFSASFFNGYR